MRTGIENKMDSLFRPEAEVEIYIGNGQFKIVKKYCKNQDIFREWMWKMFENKGFIGGGSVVEGWFKGNWNWDNYDFSQIK